MSVKANNIVQFKTRRTQSKAHSAKLIDAPLPKRSPFSSDWYDWKSLKVGGPALFIPNQKTKDVRKTANAAAERHGIKVEVRSIVVDGVPGAGVWRVA